MLIWDEYGLTPRFYGKGPATKSHEFLEKIQTAFDPPPDFWKIMLQFFMIDIVAHMRGCMMAR